MPLKAASTAKRTPQGSDAPPHTPSPPPSNPTMSDRSPARPTNGEAHAAKDDQIPTATSTSVNRKKQKRRQKQAARLAAENHHLHNGYASIDVANNAGPRDEQDLDDVEPHDSVNGDLYSDEDHDSLDAYHGVLSPSGLSHSHQAASGRSSRKKKGKKGRSDSQTIADGSSTPRSTPSISMSHGFPSSFPSHFGPRAILRSAKERNVWNTSTQEERENIKTFWLELGEEERRQLVKVEKDAVLKKMKEQQKHSCSCTVCGRKRTAIEEELEVLYDAYYEELEQYANNNQGSFEKTSPIVPPPRLYHPPLRSPGQHTRTHGQFHPSRGRVHELPEEEEEGEEDLEEEYDEEEEEEDEPYSDEEEDDDLEDEDTRAARADFFAFGNSLTVKDGILTVADDLLKNDGKHFIDMMEQLAERRMQREEDTQYGIAAAHESLHSGHNHGPLDEEDYDDEEEDDEDYDSQEEEDYEEDEMDAMTEEQRMEEGRRMFQIFAARMFEQRVLTAYREKVAEQRQQKLIEELMEEETRNEQRSVKKARESQKKKDKKRLQRQAKEEEKARRDSEKAAEEAAAKAAQEKKLEEQRQKREEQRKKREAERKAQEEERARKEAERQRRLQEERDRQAEAERKHREKKEQEKQRREEAQRKEAEEQEARETKAKEDRENKAREDELRKKSEQQDPKARDAQTAKRVSQPNIPIPSNLPHPQGPSPYSQVATPMVPKAPTPVRPRQPSFQDSHASSPRSQTASAEQSQVSVSPRSMPQSQSSGASSATSKQGLGHHPMLQHPPPPTPLSPLGSAARSHPPGLFGANGFPSHHPPGLSGMAPRQPMASDLPGYPPHTSSLMSPLRGFPATNGIHAPPGINGTHGARPMPPGRGFPLDPGHGLSSFHGQQPINNPFSPPQGGLSQARHSRQASGSFERSPLNTHAQPSPISRPSPIKRTSSTAPQDHQRDNGRTTTQQDVDELSTHLGSSALLDGTDALFNSNLSQSLPGATAPGSFRQPTRASFGAPSPFPDPLSLPKHPSFSVHPSGVGSSFNITWDDPYKK